MLRTHGGKRTAVNEITWEDGASKAVLSFPVPAELNQRVEAETEVGLISTSSTYRYARPPGWYCFYQNINFNGLSASATTGPGNGRLLKFSDSHCSSYVDFITYNFRDQTSSWYNNSSLGIYVLNWFVAPQYEQLWSENPNSGSSSVGSYSNDKADFFYACPPE